jgi:hypothetical protein
MQVKPPADPEIAVNQASGAVDLMQSDRELLRSFVLPGKAEEDKKAYCSWSARLAP